MAHAMWGRVAAFFLTLVACSATAGTTEGLSWLATQQQPNGSYEISSEISTGFQATSEAARTLTAAGNSQGLPAAVNSLNSEPYAGTEYLSRKIIANTQAAIPAPALIAQLLNNQNTDGSFGELAGYDGNALDTAYALEALAAIGQSQGAAAAGPAVQRLVLLQLADGSWRGVASESSTFVTAIALRALWLHRQNYVLSTSISKGKDYLLATRGVDGLWDETHDSALALLAVLPILTDRSAVQASVDALAQQQRPDGSWDGSVYTTALALRGLLVSTMPSPDENLIAGRILEGDTALPLAGVTASLSGPTTGTQATDAAGRYRFNNLQAGTYTLSISRAGYAGIVATTTLTVGRQVDFGDLYLLKQQQGVTTGTVIGRVTSGTTGAGISGADIRLSNGEGAVTAADGTYQIGGVDAGQITIIVSAAGFETTSITGVVPAGGVLVFSPAMEAGTSGTGTVRGIVTDYLTGAPIEGAGVASSSGATTTTGVDGGYGLGVSAGESTVTYAAGGYASLVANVSVGAGGELVLSPRLQSAPTGGSSLRGIITDAQSGLPLDGVNVSVVGPDPKAATTDAMGAYVISDIAPAQVTIHAGKSGYEAVAASAAFGENTAIEFSPALEPSADQIAVTIRGIVVNSITNAPLSGVTVSAQWAGGAASVNTSGDGSFQIANVSASPVGLVFTLDDFLTSTFAAPLQSGSDADLGQVRLRPESATTLLPDLTVEGSVEIAAVLQDGQSLQVSGQVTATIANVGTKIAPDAKVIAFADRDGDGYFSVPIDALLGQGRIGSDLAPSASLAVSITVEGSTNFRDESIAVAIDPDGAVVESDKTNNSATSALLCRAEPEPLPVTTITPTVKWRWSTQLVSSSPVVAPLRDTNGNGVIDADDDPVVLFVSHTGFVDGAQGFLRAVDGKTGTLLWSATSSALATDAGASPAVGDLDGDGVPEIVMYRYRGFGGGVVAINADGTLKWTSTLPVRADSFYNSGAPSIADIDGDGFAEVLVRRTVLNHDGTHRWTAPGTVFHFFQSIAVDMDLDGIPEILYGSFVYRNDGTPYPVPFPNVEGSPVAANFDDDAYPEFAISTYGTVRLFDNDGRQLWSKNTIGGRGGSLLAADVDGDGVPDIGIASATAYTVYRADGSILWSKTISDPSGATGSTAFDFNGDGKQEVVYHDQQFLYVYDGPTGAVIYKTTNTSATVAEQPVVVDVDADGHAEIIVVSDGSSTSGIRVIENTDDSWVPTRKVWNQHSYHVTNVDDDGGIPRNEQPSWLRNNSYRSNSFLDRSALDSVDLTAGFLRAIDGGTGSPVTLRARIGNAGLIPSKPQVIARFYEGDPMAGGVLLGQQTIASIAPGAYRDIELTGISGLIGGSNLWVKVDAADIETECDELNNTHHVPFAAAVALGDITVSTDAPMYASSAAAVLHASAANIGSLANGYAIELVVEDAEGVPVIRFAPEPTGTLAGGTSASLDRVWNTGVTIAGNYVLRGILRRDDGTLVDEATTPFAIEAPAVRASLRVTTDRPVYYTTDRVSIGSLAQNLAPNLAIPNPQIVIRVIGPDGAEVLNQTLSLLELAPGGLAERRLDQLLAGAAEGNYTVTATLLDGAGAVLATASVQYSVESNPARDLAGQVTADPAEVPRGEPVQCTDTVTNRGGAERMGQIVRRSLIRLDVEQDIDQSEATVNLSANGGTQSLTRNIDSTALEEGDYACTLEARVGDEYVPLGHAVFKVTGPRVELEGQVTADPVEVPRGEPVQCTDSVTNSGSLERTDQIVRRSLIRLDVEQDIDQIESSVNLPVDGNQILTRSIDSTSLEEGDYACTLEALIDGEYVALDRATFKVAGPRVELEGEVTADPVEVPRGEPLQCTDSVTNRGSMERTSQIVRRSLIRLDIEQDIDQIESSVNLPVDGNQILTRTIDSAPLEEGDYACTLEARIDDEYVPLDRATFKVIRPLVDLEGTLEIGERGRLLVLMDPPGAGPNTSPLCNSNLLGLGLEVDLDHPLEPDTVVQVKLLNQLGLLVDTESIRLGDFAGVVDADIGNSRFDLKILDLSADNILIGLTGSGTQDLLGNNYRIVTDIQRATGNLSFNTGLIELTCNAQLALGDVIADTFAVVGLGNQLQNHSGNGIGDGADLTNAAAQRTYLEQLLDDAGWTYKIHTDPAAFSEDLMSGGYVGYLLLSEYKVLDEQTQKVLREAVYRGDGLLVAGRHDVRTRILDPVLGLKYKGTHFQPTAISMLPLPPFTGGNVALYEGDKVQRIHNKGAVTLGKVLPSGFYDSVVTRTDFGDGKSVAVGFDLLAESSHVGLTGLMADILRLPLTLIHPDPTPPWSSRVVPVRFTIDNQSVETTGKVTITTSPGSHVVQTTQGDIVAGGIEWMVELAENESQSIDFWVQLPPGGIEATISAKTEAVDGTITYDEGTVTLDLEPTAPASIDEAIVALTAYVASQPGNGLISNLLGLILDVRTPAKRALDHLNVANGALIGGDPQIALMEMLSASDELMRDSNPLVTPIRKQLSQIVTDTARLQ